MRLPKCDDAYRHLVPKVAKRTKESCVTVGLRMCITNQSGSHVCYMNIVGNGRDAFGNTHNTKHLEEKPVDRAAVVADFKVLHHT